MSMAISVVDAQGLHVPLTEIQRNASVRVQQGTI
jgi:hypothetical protein